MGDYVIYTDTTCDIPLNILKKWEVKYSSLTFRFNGSDTEYQNGTFPIEDFYLKLKDGKKAKTSAINTGDFYENFKKILESGKDILYIGFSSALSSTFANASIAAKRLRGEYPERKIIEVDSLCASAGQGLLVSLARDKRNTGAPIEENAKFIEENKKLICHWFTVDNLEYLKRGGRISPTLAFVGNMLAIKPILHVDDGGKLVNVSKVRGRRASISALFNKYVELYSENLAERIFISHADCERDARELDKMFLQKYGRGADLITDVGPVIGAHSGPGTLALFFMGKER